MEPWKGVLQLLQQQSMSGIWYMVYGIWHGIRFMVLVIWHSTWYMVWYMVHGAADAVTANKTASAMHLKIPSIAGAGSLCICVVHQLGVANIASNIPCHAIVQT